MLDWIHHKFLRLNFLHQIKSCVAYESQLHVKYEGLVFLELCAESQIIHGLCMKIRSRLSQAL